jgi:hypothetical protein
VSNAANSNVPSVAVKNPGLFIILSLEQKMEQASLTGLFGLSRLFG